MKTVIDVRGIGKHFGEIRAVDDVTFSVEAGEIFGLIGHNGAGKSTLIRMLLGLLAPDAGEVRIDGAPLAGPDARERRRHIAYLPENVVFYDNLSGLETLRFFAELKGTEVAQCRPLLRKVGLDDAATRPVRGYSKGMRQRLALAQALLGEPQLMFFDEPTTGLDPSGIREFYDLLAELKDRGVTMILSSHNLAEIQERVDRLALMRLGRLQAVGTVRALREKLDLPVRIRFSLRPGAETRLRAAFDSLPDCTLHHQGAESYLHCAPALKIPALARLTALTGDIDDLSVHEPSLEDVFLGYAEERS
ncbi:MAG: ABC transporter ATP-binding protein [Pseudomonadota bacterium]